MEKHKIVSTSRKIFFYFSPPTFLETYNQQDFTTTEFDKAENLNKSTFSINYLAECSEKNYRKTCIKKRVLELKSLSNK